MLDPEVQPGAFQVLGGLLDEAHALLQAGVTANSSQPSRAIGYRQALEWLVEIGDTRSADAAAVKSLAAAIQGASRRLQRSQLVFHRDDEQYRWVDAAMGAEDAAAEIMRRFSAEMHEGVNTVISVFASQATRQGNPLCDLTPCLAILLRRHAVFCVIEIRRSACFSD
jgi:hypothetical protein